MLSRRTHHEQPKSSPCDFRLERLQDGEWILNVGSSPGCSGLRHPEVSTRSRAASLDLDAGFRYSQQLAGLMLGKNAGDVVVDNHDFIDLAEPLFGEHSDRG